MGLVPFSMHALYLDFIVEYQTRDLIEEYNTLWKFVGSFRGVD
jgi:hypothetical protein